MLGRENSITAGSLSGFDAGIRGSSFALAASAWLPGSGAFAPTATGIVAVPPRRRSGTQAAEAIRLGRAVLCGDTSADGHADPVARGLPTGSPTGSPTGREA